MRKPRSSRPATHPTRPPRPNPFTGRGSGFRQVVMPPGPRQLVCHFRAECVWLRCAPRWADPPAGDGWACAYKWDREQRLPSRAVHDQRSPRAAGSATPGAPREDRHGLRFVVDDRRQPSPDRPTMPGLDVDRRTEITTCPTQKRPPRRKPMLAQPQPGLARVRDRPGRRVHRNEPRAGHRLHQHRLDAPCSLESRRERNNLR